MKAMLKEIGERICKRRKSMSYTQEQIAEGEGELTAKIKQLSDKDYRMIEMIAEHCTDGSI